MYVEREICTYIYIYRVISRVPPKGSCQSVGALASTSAGRVPDPLRPESDARNAAAHVLRFDILTK